MRRSLILLLVVVAFAVATRTVQAADITWSGGVSITEKTNQSGLFMWIDAYHCGRYIGTWYSTSSQLPEGPDCLEYRVFLAPVGVAKIKKQTFSGSDVGTIAATETAKGACAVIPPFYSIEHGGRILTFGVNAKDVKKMLMLVVLPINYTGTRDLTVGTFLHYQFSPRGYESWDDWQAFLNLRGFEPAWSTPDVGRAAAMNAAQQMGQPPVNQPPLRVMDDPKTEIRSEGVIETYGTVEPPKPAPKPTMTVALEVRLVYITEESGESRYFLRKPAECQRIEGFEATDEYTPNRDCQVWRSGQYVCDAKIGEIRDGVMKLYVVSKEYLQGGDKICLKEVVQ